MAKRDPYLKALDGILHDAGPAPPTTLTRTEIESRIEVLSMQLRGALSNPDRLDILEARRTLRKQLAALA